MADTTKMSLRRLQIYSVFVRNHTAEGTLKALAADLPRIKQLGTDFVWLLPFNPVGQVARKGELGSPYAIQDYRKVDPLQGTWQDFKDFVTACHQLGLKVMVDVVFNHTARDSVLLQQQPNWFLRNQHGQLKNKNPDWTDVAELDYRKTALWQTQLTTLKQYAALVDGFRCDVAPQVPLQFWLQARQEIAQINPELIWLAESTDGQYIRKIRQQGFPSATDGELYRAFDLTYDYDVYPTWRRYLAGELALRDYVAFLNQQDVTYPANAIKLRFLENHDQPRAHALIPNLSDLRNWTAFSAFQKGVTLIYAGQEYGMKHTPSLFDADRLQWPQTAPLAALITKMHQLSQDQIQIMGNYQLFAQANDIVEVVYQTKTACRVGIFSLRSQSGHAKVVLPDGRYQNLITGQPVTVHYGVLAITGQPVVIDTRRQLPAE